jgi:predicted RNA binding protein YcfA (HicA-like mRNA interferase family)
MKRRDLISHLEKNGCVFFREGSNHTIYINSKKKLTSSIPRHREINDFLAKKICRDLGV